MATYERSYERQYELETDWWGTARARLRMHLEDIEVTMDSEWTCHVDGCSTTVERQAAIATLRRLIDEWPPPPCEHQEAVLAQLGLTDDE